jgi:non-specific serine/threonine protein kinase
MKKTAGTLRKLVYPFILRRTKEQVAPELPPRTERIVYTDMDTAQKKLYNPNPRAIPRRTAGPDRNEGMNNARFKILEGLLRLRQIAIHPALVDKKYKGEAPKFEILLETLETLQAENHKALIFSQFVETLKLVEEGTGRAQIKYIYLDGQTQNRQAKWMSSRTTRPSLLPHQPQSGRRGFEPDRRRLRHPPRPVVESRRGNASLRPRPPHRADPPVFVYKIIARGTVEEKILQLQEKKRALVKNIIATEASFFKSLTQDDVKGFLLDTNNNLSRSVTCAHMTHCLCRIFERIRSVDDRGDLTCLDQIFDKRQIICIR